ncbi:MAG: tetratricopeptide repeat protein [Chloroflexota bacterium]
MTRHYKLLGTLEIVEDGIPSQLMQSPRGCALVSYLIVTREAQTREHLADLLWESTSTKQALRRLRQVLYRIRPFIPELQVTRRTVAFHPTPETHVDLHELDQLLAQTELRHLESGLMLFKGNLLNNLYLEDAPRFNEWLLMTQEQLHHRLFNVFRQVCKLIAENGEWQRGVALCRHWTTIDELNEEAYRWLIHMLLGQGDREAAYQTYEIIRQRLQDELGIEPEKATLQIAQNLIVLQNQLDEPTEVSPEETSLHGPLPPHSVFPYHRNAIFAGRAAELQQLVNTLLPDTTTGSSGTKTAAIMGMGGLGKTQLAVEFAYRYGRYFSGGVLLGNFCDEDNVAELIANIGGEHAMRLFTDGDKFSLAKKIELVKRAWQEPIPRLLVFDNCEDENLAATWLPVTGGCRVLITSRRSNWSKTLPIKHVALPVLQRGESIHLLQHLADHLQQHEADKVAEAVGDLPLALHLAGSFLSQHRDITCNTYIDQLEAQTLIEHQSLRGMHTNFSPTGHELDVGRTFAVSWQKLNTSLDSDRIALAVLDVAACFAPNEPLPQTILVETVSSLFPDVHSRLIEQSIEQLVALGFIRAEQPETIVFHPLVAAFIQVASASWPARKSFVEAKVADITNERQSQDINLYQLPIPAVHFRYLTEHAVNNEAIAYQLKALLGNHFIAIAAFEQADAYLRQAKQLAISLFGAASVEHGHILYLQCKLKYKLGQPDETIELGKETLEILPKEASLTKANVLETLGYTNILLTKMDAAKHQLEEALAIHKKIDDLASGYYANLLESLGQYQITSGNFEEAKTYFLDALAILEGFPGTVDVNIANMLNIISATYGYLGDIQEAKRYGEQSLQLSERSFGVDSLISTRAMTNLGVVEWRLGNFEAARIYFEKGLKIFQVYYPENHFLIADATNNVGEVLSQLGQYDQALEHHQTALKIRIEVFGERHYETVRSLSMIGEVYLRQTKHQQASEILEKALSIQEEVDNNPQAITDTLSLLAEAKMAMGDFQEAKLLLDRALSIREEAFGAENLETAAILMQLGDWYVRMDQPQKAAVFYQRCQTAYQHSGETSHPNFLRVQSKLAAIS